MADDVTRQIEKEVNDLQVVLKDELRSQQELGNLENQLSEETFSLEKKTEEHRTVAAKTKWRMFFKAFLYYVLAGALAGILLLILYRTFFK
jgi:hypothetical protein